MKVDGLDPQTLKALSDAIKTVRQLKSVFNPDQIDLISQAIASVQKMLPENLAELRQLLNQPDGIVKPDRNKEKIESTIEDQQTKFSKSENKKQTKAQTDISILFKNDPYSSKAILFAVLLNLFITASSDIGIKAVSNAVELCLECIEAAQDYIETQSHKNQSALPNKSNKVKLHFQQRGKKISKADKASCTKKKHI